VREDIMDKVARALRLGSVRREAVTAMNLPWFFRHAMTTYVGAQGTGIPSLLESGRMHCLIPFPHQIEFPVDVNDDLHPSRRNGFDAIGYGSGISLALRKPETTEAASGSVRASQHRHSPAPPD
jgi:hypothetical protein